MEKYYGMSYDNEKNPIKKESPEDLEEPKLPYVCFKARMNILVPFLTVMLVKGMSDQLLLVPW